MSSGDTRQIPAPEGVDKAVRKKISSRITRFLKITARRRGIKDAIFLSINFILVRYIYKAFSQHYSAVARSYSATQALWISIFIRRRHGRFSTPGAAAGGAENQDPETIQSDLRRHSAPPVWARDESVAG
jgi:hypothetical protein